MSDPRYSKLSDIIAGIKLPDAPLQFNQTRIFQDWNQAAGAAIAENTLNLSIDGSILSVTVNSPTWAHELINNQSTILARLMESGYKNLQEMAIRVNVTVGRKLAQQSKVPQESQPLTPAISPRLKHLFIEIAENSSNPDTKATFMRLSKLDSPEK